MLYFWVVSEIVCIVWFDVFHGVLMCFCEVKWFSGGLI